MGLADVFRPPVVGLDLGSHTVKAVALRQSRRGWTLLAAGEQPMPVGERVTQEQVSETAGALLDTLGLRRAQIASALSGQAVIVKRLALPPMSTAELAEAIPWEAEQYIPFALADVQLDYQVLGGPRALPADALDVLLVAARRDRVDQRLEVVTATGRRPAVLDVEAFALANANEVNYPNRTDALTGLLHIGRNATIVCVLERGQVVFTRDVGVGGGAYLEALEREIGLDAAGARRVLHSHKGGDDQNVAAVLREVHLQLILEVRKTLDFYWSTAESEPLSRIVLSGGASQIDGLSDLLDHEFQTTVERFDPFRQIVRPSSAVGADLDGPGYAVAVGLALRREGDR
jgi:type IV pilus assembly protein PilM